MDLKQLSKAELLHNKIKWLDSTIISIESKVQNILTTENKIQLSISTDAEQGGLLIPADFNGNVNVVEFFAHLQEQSEINSKNTFECELSHSTAIKVYQVIIDSYILQRDNLIKELQSLGVEI